MKTVLFSKIICRDAFKGIEANLQLLNRASETLRPESNVTVSSCSGSAHVRSLKCAERRDWFSNCQVPSLDVAAATQSFGAIIRTFKSGCKYKL